jgi:hypothetical protein
MRVTAQGLSVMLFLGRATCRMNIFNLLLMLGVHHLSSSGRILAQKPRDNSLCKVNSMDRIDQKSIPNDTKEVRLFMVGIDSAHLIPHVLKHHFDIGVDRVFYIDNNSKDNSISLLEAYDNVHIWSQKKKFDQENSKSGAVWVEELLSEYGVGNWCLLLDLDELFVFPGYENRSIKDFVKEQQDSGFEYVGARHIDMYSNRKVKDTMIKGSLLESCPYYDRSEYGCRDRVLEYKSYYQKTPLVLYKPSMVIATGYHSVSVQAFSLKIFISNIIRRILLRKPIPLTKNEKGKHASETGAILHFKFICNLTDFILHHGDNMTSSDVKKAMYAGVAELNFYDKAHSVTYSGSSDLKYFEQFTFWSKRVI